MKKNITKNILIFLLLILSSISVNALYLGKGVDSSLPTYAIGGITGVWTEALTSQTKSRNGQYTGASIPLIKDLDGDGTNDIIILNNNTLEVLEYVTGSGFQTQASISVGNTVYQGSTIDYDTQQTVGLQTWNSKSMIVVTNITHMLTYEFNGSILILNQSAATGIRTGANVVQLSLYPVIRCASFGNFLDNTTHCFVLLENRTTVGNLTLIDYNLDSNIVNSTSVLTHTTPNIIPEGYNLHLANIDGASGDYELGFSISSLNNKDLWLCQVGGIAVSNSCSQIHTRALGGSFRSSDIIISDIDANFGNGLEYTYAYTLNGLTWDAETVRWDTTELSTGYFISNIDADVVSINGVSAFKTSDGQYCADTSGVIFYFSDYNGNDKIYCFSQKYGEDTELTVILNDLNETGLFHIHLANIFGSGFSSLILDSHAIHGDSAESLGFPLGEFVYAEDYQNKGLVDIIGVTDGTLWYMDDLTTNPQVNIDNILPDTGVPYCVGEVIGYSLTVTDTSDNTAYCWIEESYTNNTKINNQSNITFNVGDAVELEYNADKTGNYLLRFYCTDTYNTDIPDMVNEIITTGNNTDDCHYKGEDPPASTSFITTDDEESDAALCDTAHNLVCIILGLCGAAGRNISALLIVLLFVGFAFIKTKSIELSIGSGIIGSLICLLLCLMSVFPFIVIVIVSIALIVWTALKN